MRYISLLLLLSGCTVTVKHENEGFSKQEVATAFQQRDQALQVLAKELVALKEGKEKK